MLWLWLGCQTTAVKDCPAASNPHQCIQESIQSFEGTVEQALELCDTLTDERLKGECAFLFSDEGKLTGELARNMCAAATPFEEDCLRHAAARDVEQNIYPNLKLANPTPMKVVPRIFGVVSQYLPSEIAEPMSRDMMIRLQASKIEGSFDISDCNGLTPSLCAQVYIVASLGSRGQWSEHVEEPWMSHCGTVLLVEKATEWGWKSWTNDVDATVQTAYQQLCQALPAANTDSSK